MSEPEPVPSRSHLTNSEGVDGNIEEEEGNIEEGEDNIGEGEGNMEMGEGEEGETVCPHCNKHPRASDDIHNLLAEHGEELKENDQTLTNKNLQFHLYRLASENIHGRLGAGRRIPLPRCVQGDIMDLYPDCNHDYVGFREAGN